MTLEKITKKEANKLFLKGIKEEVLLSSLSSVYAGAFFAIGLTGKVSEYDFLGIPMRPVIFGIAGGWGLASSLGFRKAWKDWREYHSNTEEYVQKHYGKSLK